MKKPISLLALIAVMMVSMSYSPAIVKRQYVYDVKIGHRLLGELKVTKQEMGDREAFEFHHITKDGLLRINGLIHHAQPL